MTEHVKPEIRRAIFELVEAAPAPHPFDELEEWGASHHASPRPWLLATAAALAVVLAGSTLVLSRVNPWRSRSEPLSRPVYTGPVRSTGPVATESSQTTTTPSSVASTTAPGPSTSAAPTKPTLPRLAVTAPDATLLFGQVFRTNGSADGCCFQQVFRPSEERMGAPVVWLYDGENNLADNFSGRGVRAVAIRDGLTGQMRETQLGDQLFIELLFRPTAHRRALLLSLGLSREDVLAMAATTSPREAIGYDPGPLPATLRQISEGTLGNLSIDEQSQIAYSLGGGGAVGIMQFDSGREMLEETVSSSLLSTESVDVRTVNGREAIALTTTRLDGQAVRRVRLLWPDVYGWVELTLRDVPVDHEAAVLASVAPISNDTFSAALEALPPTTAPQPGTAPTATMP